MIKDALEYIIGLKKPETIEVDGRTFMSRNYEPLKAPYNATVHLHTLTSLVDLIKKECKETTLIVNVKSPVEVEVVSEEYGCELQRDTYYTVSAVLPSLSFSAFDGLGMEEFIVELQSKFIKDDNRDALLQFASHIRFEDGQEIWDDGVSQMATVKTGITKLENLQVPNPVALRPYRTFLEVEQPSSDFVFRINKNGRFKLMEADGGAWKNEATNNIKKYLTEALKDFPKITVIA